MANATFSKKTDYFGMAGAGSRLALLESHANFSRSIAETAEVSVINARDVSGDFLNPSCTYALRSSGQISFTLGEAFTVGDFSFFLTAVEIKTAAAQFPVITFTGTANEGADAIKTHSVTVDLLARSKAQDVAGAFTVTAPARLIDCAAIWSAEAVVVADVVNGVLVPVASDIQHGKLEVDATTVLGAPSVRSGSGFAATITPDPAGVDAYYETWAASAVKSLT